METERTELMEIELAVEACNAVAVPEPIRAALVRDLGPVANRLAKYAQATTRNVICEEDAIESAKICADIAADISTVKDHEVLSKITAGLHDLHRKWTGLRDLFVAPMERDRKAIKEKIIVWQESERKKAEEIQRKLQAAADLKAAQERARLEKEAAAIKTPELRAARLEQAASVIAPTVTVAAPKSGLRTSKAWKVKKIDLEVFFKALAERHDLSGYVEVQIPRMERAKAANPSAEIPGVTFELITR
jgi:hypothetical protein